MSKSKIQIITASEQEDILKQTFEYLKENQLKLATAESCTGGKIASLITSLSGSSAIFQGGVVSYSNLSKINLLGVNEETLEMHGTVSEEVAAEMAAGALEKFNADIAISTTGIAGPEGGSKEKPVGTVCFGLAKAGQVKTFRKFFEGARERVQVKATNFALSFMCD